MGNGHGGARSHSGRPRLGTPTPYRSKEWLQEQSRTHTEQAIALECGVSVSTIHDWMCRHDLIQEGPELPPLTERHDPEDKVWADLVFLERTKGYTLREVAEAAGCTHEMVRLARIRHRIEGT